MTNSDEIQFECPECGEVIRVSLDQSGERMGCPACDVSLLVPTQADGEDLFAGLEIPGEELADATGAAADRDEPIRVEGISDSLSYDDVFGVHCRICETLIHVRPEQAGQTVECPICFSQVPVPTTSPEPEPGQEKDPGTKDAPSPEAELPTMVPEENPDELRLSDPIERPEIDMTLGLDPVTQDLLTPKPATVGDPGNDISEIAEIEIIDSTDDSELGDPDIGASNSTESVPPPLAGSEDGTVHEKKKRTRRERLEAAHQKHDETDANRSFLNPTGAVNRLGQETNFPDYNLGSTAAAVGDMLATSGVIWRALVAVLLMCFGVVVMESFAPIYVEDASAEPGPMLDRLIISAQWVIVGFTPYLLGLIFLWFAASYVFRDAALGQRQVTSWKNSGRAEVTGTISLFSFGFFIAGLPMVVPAFLDVALILPLQIMVAPLFLLSAWFNQSPFAIVSVDAFANVGKQRSQWKAFYTFMLALGFGSVILALLFLLRNIIPIYGVNVIISMLGTAGVALVTLAFAAATGWHCGRMVADLEESA